MAEDPRSPAKNTVWISLDRIVIPQNARQHTPSRLAELTEDMNAQGQLQEIIVTPMPSECEGDSGCSCFEVLAGVGRVQAARKLGWERIRAFVRTGITAAEKAHITFSENQKREDAHPFYQAVLLKDMLVKGGYDQKQLAQQVSMNEAEMSRHLALLDLPEAIQEQLRSTRLTMSHFREFLRLPVSDQETVIASCVAHEWSSKQLRTVVNQRLAASGKRGRKAGSKNRRYADPLAADWIKVMNDPELKKLGNWTVRYHGNGQAWSIENIQLHSSSAGIKPALAQFLKLIAKTLENETTSPNPQ